MDKREKKYALVVDTLHRWGIQAQASVLEVGDYAVLQSAVTIGISRKSWSDFLSSLNRDPSEGPAANLYEDLRRLRNTYDVAALMLEGLQPGCIDTQLGYLCRFEDGRRVLTGITVEAYNNFILSVQTKGLLFLPTVNLQHTIQVLRDTHRYAAKPFHRALTAMPLSAQGRLLQIYGAMPGVGPRRAEALAQKFSSLDAFMSGLNSLDSIDGIGPLTAEKVRHFVRYGVEKVDAAGIKAEGL